MHSKTGDTVRTNGSVSPVTMRKAITHKLDS